MQPLPPPVQLVETSEDKLKQYDGTDPKKSLLMANRGQIYDVSQRRRSYDVFLSFRGTDVRNYFLSHLYTALVQSGINTYVDNEDLKKGEQISTALMKAIEESQIAIVVFSKNYASSLWCLEEVAKIMECKEQRGLMVFPVFYKVEPREVRRQRQDYVYTEAMAKHEVKFGKDSEKVKRWKNALLDAGSLSGWPFMDGPNTSFSHQSMMPSRFLGDRTSAHHLPSATSRSGDRRFRSIDSVAVRRNQPHGASSLHIRYAYSKDGGASDCRA
ncbi:hypothetical protein EUGRSUZ_H01749 [Eucalyptus grandis]|uniref:Uncharacterized protein n=2 Tax=Eucalyptus grandis TaxID=71139 RepID=A0ACC3JRH4_EUCGR|nr:hypothetical protein EUGRSUZ_H01749 [Eucalyptus grandis]